MKKLFLLLLLVLPLSGCLKVDTMDGIVIYTSVYPIEYVTKALYGDYAEVSSIYPDGVNVETYELTEKLISDFSNGDLLIYNGLSDEKLYAAEMINQNGKLKIIDASQGMEIDNSLEELWIDPSNLLMIAQNVKNGLEQYITSSYLEQEIENNYEDLKLYISEIDATLKEVVQNADQENIVVGSASLLFLEKYGLNVIYLGDEEAITDKILSDTSKLIDDGEIEYIYLEKFDEGNDTITDFVSKYGISLKIINPISNITEDERQNKENYISIMEENIEALKEELYK